MTYNDEWHAKQITAALLGDKYALVYLRLNSSKRQSRNWTDEDIEDHLATHYPDPASSGTTAAVVLASAAGEDPKPGDWEPGLQEKKSTGNANRQLFILVPVGNAKEHEVEELAEEKHSLNHVFTKTPQVLEWAKGLAYKELISRNVQLPP